MLEEIGEGVDRPRRKVSNKCKTQIALEPLNISAINYLSSDEYKRRMIDHKWEEFLVFQPVQKLTTV